MGCRQRQMCMPWDAHGVGSVCDVHVYRLLLVARYTAEATVSLEPMRLEPQGCVRGQSHAANGVSCYTHGQLLHPIPRRVCTGKLHMLQMTCDICTHTYMEHGRRAHKAVTLNQHSTLLLDLLTCGVLKQFRPVQPIKVDSPQSSCGFPLKD